MSASSSKLGLIGKIIGGILFLLGVVCVFFIDFKKEPEVEPELIRPLKTMVLESTSPFANRRYPGRVRAFQEVKLAFEVNGTITNIYVGAGSRVTNSQLLAALDIRDFQDARDAAQAELERVTSYLGRIEKARLANAVSEDDLSAARAAVSVAQADLNIKSKAVEDTRLRARFDGVISERFAETFENISQKQPIFGLQSLTNIEIEVFLPEARVALINKGTKKEDVRFQASFDFLPDRVFKDLTIKEFSTEADPNTQTFRLTLAMEAPDDVVILPGMTVSIMEIEFQGSGAQSSAFAIPLDAVPVDGVGQYYVWLVTPGSGGNHVVNRKDVEVAEMSDRFIQVKGGVGKGDRIALAGVHMLQEGQQVRLLQP